MTWEIDIVNRAGKFYVSGQFRIGDAAELFTFASRLSELVERAGIKKRPVIDQSKKPSEPKAEIETKKVEPQKVEPKKIIKKKKKRNGLSPRENEVRKLVEKGCDNDAISKFIGISLNLVHHYKSAIRRKMGPAQ